MASSPDQFINKLIVPIGVFIILGMASLVLYKQNEKELEKKEQEIAPYFVSFKKYSDRVLIPNAEILGPKGRVFKLRDYYDGQYLILNIWATWCTPCIKELPKLNKIQYLFGDGQYRVLAVSINNQQDIEDIVKFVNKYKVQNVASFHDYKGQLQRGLPIRDLPVTFIIDKNGRILYEITGDADWTHTKIISFLRFLKTVY